MLKKLLLGVVAIIVLFCAVVFLYVFSLTAERPDEVPEVSSVVQLEAFHAAGMQADNWLASLYSSNTVPSMSAAVAIKGDVVWVGTIGYADLDKKIPATADTGYRIGSISKSMTAAAVMSMSEKGLIDINSPFNTYVNDLPAAHTGYTIKQLLSHQAGIRHYVKGFSENYNTKAYPNTRTAVSIIESDALLYPPGEGFHYSTYGYNLVALAMESAASLSLEDIMSKEVFTPIGMSATYFDKAKEPVKEKKATPYLLVSGALLEASAADLSDRYAGGGYISTPTDLVKFGSALMGNDFLMEDSKNTLWTPVSLANGAMNPEFYALGFRVGQDELGRFVHHGGMSIGGYSFLLIYPDLGVVVTFMSNFTPMDSSFDRMQEAKKLVNIFSSSR